MQPERTFFNSKTTINMKRLNLWMLVAILSCGLLTTSCSEIDNPVPVRELSNSIDEFWDMPGNAGDPEVVAESL